jgi:L-phenylalanine/L-methionine N-acetyltransferase
MTVTVRRATPNDAAAFARIMSDPAVYPGLLQMPLGNEHQWRERLTESCAAAKPDLVLAAELDGEVVGNAGLHPCGTAVRRHHAMNIGMAVAGSAQRRGVGSALMAAICDWADNWAGALRLELTVYTDNAAGLALYRKFGFVHEGTHRAFALRNGVYVDVHAMARLHPKQPLVPAP